MIAERNVLWTEIHEPMQQCAEISTANDNMFDGLSLARVNRQAYEEMAA